RVSVPATYRWAGVASDGAHFACFDARGTLRMFDARGSEIATVGNDACAVHAVRASGQDGDARAAHEAQEHLIVALADGRVVAIAWDGREHRELGRLAGAPAAMRILLTTSQAVVLSAVTKLAAEAEQRHTIAWWSLEEPSS